MATSTSIILVAGTVTFGNEWLQTNQPNWRIPIATMGAAFIFSGLDKLSSTAATGVSLMVLIAALVTPFNGKSAVQEFSSVLPTKAGKK